MSQRRVSFTQSAWIVMIKELKDAVRDRRSLLSVLIFPFLMPIMIYFMFDLMADRFKEASERPVLIAHQERGPEIVEFLQRQGVEILEAPEDPEEAVRLSLIHI